jgi:hypothetical protein
MRIFSRMFVQSGSEPSVRTSNNPLQSRRRFVGWALMAVAPFYVLNSRRAGACGFNDTAKGVLGVSMVVVGGLIYRGDQLLGVALMVGGTLVLINGASGCLSSELKSISNQMQSFTP